MQGEFRSGGDGTLRRAADAAALARRYVDGAELFLIAPCGCRADVELDYCAYLRVSLRDGEGALHVVGRGVFAVDKLTDDGAFILTEDLLADGRPFAGCRVKHLEIHVCKPVGVANPGVHSVRGEIGVADGRGRGEVEVNGGVAEIRGVVHIRVHGDAVETVFQILRMQRNGDPDGILALKLLKRDGDGRCIVQMHQQGRLGGLRQIAGVGLRAAPYVRADVRIDKQARLGVAGERVHRDIAAGEVAQAVRQILADDEGAAAAVEGILPCFMPAAAVKELKLDVQSAAIHHVPVDHVVGGNIAVLCAGGGGGGVDVKTAGGQVCGVFHIAVKHELVHTLAQPAQLQRDLYPGVVLAKVSGQLLLRPDILVDKNLKRGRLGRFGTGGNRSGNLRGRLLIFRAVGRCGDGRLNQSGEHALRVEACEEVVGMHQIAAAHIIEVLALQQTLVNAGHLHHGDALLFHLQHCGLIGGLRFGGGGNHGVCQCGGDQENFAVGVCRLHFRDDGGEICRKLRGAQVSCAVVHAEGDDQKVRLGGNDGAVHLLDAPGGSRAAGAEVFKGDALSVDGVQRLYGHFRPGGGEGRGIDRTGNIQTVGDGVAQKGDLHRLARGKLGCGLGQESALIGLNKAGVGVGSRMAVGNGDLQPVEGTTLAREDPAAVGSGEGAADDLAVRVHLVIAQARHAAAGEHAQLSVYDGIILTFDIFYIQRGGADGDDLADGIQQGNVRNAAVLVLHDHGAFLIHDGSLVEGRGVCLNIVFCIVQQRVRLRRRLRQEFRRQTDGTQNGEGIGRVRADLFLTLIPTGKGVAFVCQCAEGDLRALLHRTGGHAGDAAALFRSGVDRMPEVDACGIHQVVAQRCNVLADVQIQKNSCTGEAGKILGERDIPRGVIPAAALVLAKDGGVVRAVGGILGECAPAAVVQHLNLQVDLTVTVADVGAEPTIRAEEAAGGVFAGRGVEINAAVRAVAVAVDVCGDAEVVFGIAVELGNVNGNGNPDVVLPLVGGQVCAEEVIVAVDHDPDGGADGGFREHGGGEHR